MSKKTPLSNICEKFPVTDDEYRELEKSFGQLTKYAAWQLIKKNTRNSHTDDFDDVNQQLLWSLYKAGSYYKRQIYIEKCLEVTKKYVKDDLVKFMLEELESLWKNRTRHGANRQKFGEFQECLLEKLVNKIVPVEEQPARNALLVIDSKFSTYCKAIAWNTLKSIGRKITREKSIRSGQVSINDFDYLCS